MTQNCNSFYGVKSGDGCYDIANDNGISLSDFYAYNPTVGSDCSKLYPDTYLCVGVAQSCTIDMTFKTAHSTEWGENVWVVGSLPELGEWDVSKALMLTGSSEADSTTNWEGSVKLPAGVHVSYKFVKLQTDGTPAWEEDSNRDFDTSSCGGPDLQEGGKWHDGSPSCIAVDVVFETRTRRSYGEAVYLVGSIPSLGQWSAGNAVALSADSYTESDPFWKGTVNLRTGQDVEYKFIKMDRDGGFTWEADPNRQLTVPTDCGTVPVQGGQWHT